VGCGLPLGTAQKPQRRVQISPNSMKVAVLWFQHSPILGHCADSQTVCRPNPRASFLRLWKLSPTGALALSHDGLGILSGPPSSICTSWEVPAMDCFDSISLAGPPPQPTSTQPEPWGQREGMPSKARPSPHSESSP